MSPARSGETPTSPAGPPAALGCPGPEEARGGRSIPAWARPRRSARPPPRKAPRPPRKSRRPLRTGRADGSSSSSPFSSNCHRSPRPGKPCTFSTRMQSPSKVCVAGTKYKIKSRAVSAGASPRTARAAARTPPRPWAAFSL